MTTTTTIGTDDDAQRDTVTLRIGHELTHNPEFLTFVEGLATIRFDGTLAIRYTHGKVDISRLETSSTHPDFDSPFRLRQQLQALQETERSKDEVSAQQ